MVIEGFEVELATVEMTDPVMVTGHKRAIVEEPMVMKLGGFEVELAMVETVDPVMVTGYETPMVKELAVMKLEGSEVDAVTVTRGKTPMVERFMGMKSGGMELVMMEVAERVTAEAMARPQPKSHPATMAETAAPCPCGRGCEEAEENEGPNRQPHF